MSARLARLAGIVSVLVGLCACTKPAPDGAQTTASATPSAAPAPNEASAPDSGAAKAPSTGSAATFEGTYTTTAVAAITVPEGAKWKGEEGQDGVGEGKLKLDIDAEGRVTGTVEGALGAGLLEGRRSGDLVTATIRRKDPADQGFYGTVDGKVAGDKVEGTVSASRGNAGMVREGKFSLGKK